MNPVIQAFMMKQQKLSEAGPVPNPDSRRGAIPLVGAQNISRKTTFHEIVDKKPSKKTVMKYIKTRLNELYASEHSESD